MGFRFRKSFKIMPGVRMTVGKKGASMSIGTRGATQSFSTSGRKTTSIGIPGTGLSYVSTSNSKKSKSKKSPTPGTRPNNKPLQKPSSEDGIWVRADSPDTPLNYAPVKKQHAKKPFYKRWWFITIVVILVLGLLGTPSEDDQKTDPEQVATVQEEETTQAKEASEPSEEVPPAEAPSEEVTAEAEAISPAEETVYISQTGSKYHSRSTCSNMSSPSEVSVSRAQEIGLEPCSKCY